MSLNLDDFNKLGALMSNDSDASRAGKILKLSISLIDEDPEQPRTETNPGFSEESISELADTIRERGVKSPISVRDAGNGRYIINHGARRYRASIHAGLDEIPVVIDNDYTKLDQVIENIQRNNLTANEIADFIRDELAKGKNKKEIASELGKSNAWVTQYCCIIDIPEEISPFWEAGVLGDDVTALSELCKCFKKDSDKTLGFMEGAEKLSRREIADLREMIDNGADIDSIDTPKAEGVDKDLSSRKTDEYSEVSSEYSPDDEDDEDDKSESAPVAPVSELEQYAVSDSEFGEYKTISCVYCRCTLDFSDTEYQLVNVSVGDGKVLIKNNERHFIVPVNTLILSNLCFE